MAIVIANTKNATYVIDTDEGRVERYGAEGRRAWMLEVSAVMSARPLDEAGIEVMEGALIRGPAGQALAPMPETAGNPAVGLRMILYAGSGGHILTTPVISAGHEQPALAA